MKSIPKLLSKTKLLRGYRCLKCIYLTIHHPELEAPITPETQALFDQGNMVGSKAREYYPGGILIDNKPWDFGGALTKTRQLMAEGATILYEAAFEYAGCYARADIIRLNPETNRWRIYEVKSSTKVKPEHYDDAGLQAWIMAKNTIPLEQINIVHLNSDCRYPDLSNLFKEVDVTAEVRERYQTIQPKLKEIFETIKQPEVPDIDIGPYCKEPTECGFISHCWKKIPELSIFNLPRIDKKMWELYEAGIIELDDPRLVDLNDLQMRMINCFKSKERHVNSDAIKAELTNWQYPLIFLDFETINPAIPRYDGTRPFEQIPFQFSAFEAKSASTARQADLIHSEFLHISADDPRPTLIPALLEACGDTGSIVAYHARFEKDRIQALADFSPQHRDALLKLLDRFVDPLPLIRETIYDNAFAGSFSLKYVAPALLGDAHSYTGMLVANGGDAQRAFEEVISERTSPGRRELLRTAMIEYCKKDTYVMVELVRWLYSTSS